MPPTAKRNASVILFDVNTKPEFLERSQKCLMNICAGKWFQKSNDCTKLILLNTADTNNTLSTKFGKCPHIVEATGVINYDPKLIQPHITDVKTGPGDWLLGLAVAIEAIKQEYFEAKGVMTIQLLLISDFNNNNVKPKEKSIKFIIEQLNHMNVYLYIMGPEVKIPKWMMSYNDIKEWSKNIEFVNNANNLNFPIIKEIVGNTKGVVCDLDIGENIFSSYINYWGLQPWKVPLTIGSELVMNCSTVRFLRKLILPRTKGVTQEGYNEPWKWHMMEDINEEVPYDNVVGGVFKHNKFIPLSKDVEANFKYHGERVFSIVGFTKSKNIPEYYINSDGASYVETDGSKLFNLLLNTLAEQDKCAIARRVSMANCKPKLVALIPNVHEGIFILVELPYKESLNTTFKEHNTNLAIKLDTQDPAVVAAYNYLQQLDITSNENQDSVKWPLSSDLMYDMRLKVVNQRFLKKYLDQEFEITAGNEITIPRLVDDVSTLKEFIPAADADV